ncbi:MAG: helix-turn-helix transcriptional regulator [Candidatus Gastranaerophilales bacterium]
MITMKELFALNIKRIRKELGLTQEKFAELIEVHERNITDFERAKYMPTPANVDKICKNLNLPVSTFFMLDKVSLGLEKQEKINAVLNKLSLLEEEKFKIVYDIIVKVF